MVMARNREWLHFPAYVCPSSAKSAEDYRNSNGIHDQILPQPCSEASFTPELRQAFLSCLLRSPFRHPGFAGGPCISSWTPWTSKSFWGRYPTLWDCFIALYFISVYGQVRWVVPCYTHSSKEFIPTCLYASQLPPDLLLSGVTGHDSPLRCHKLQHAVSTKQM